MVFSRDAFEEILIRELALRGETPSAWARRIGVSPGTLHDIRAVDPQTGSARRTPSPAMVRRFADGLGVPITAICEPRRVSA